MFQIHLTILTFLELLYWKYSPWPIPWLFHLFRHGTRSLKMDQVPHHNCHTPKGIWNKNIWFLWSLNLCSITHFDRLSTYDLLLTVLSFLFWTFCVVSSNSSLLMDVDGTITAISWIIWQLQTNIIRMYDSLNFSIEFIYIPLTYSLTQAKLSFSQ